MCDLLHNKKNYVSTTVYNAKNNCLRSLISESHTLVEKAMTSWVKGCPRARGAEPTEGVQVPWMFRVSICFETLEISNRAILRRFGWHLCCLVMQLETGCKVVEIEIPTADGYPVASWWDCKHCGKMWNCTHKVCSVPVFLVIPSLLVCAMLESWWVKQRQALHRHVISLSHVQQQAMTSFKCSNKPQCTTKHFRAC